MTTARRYRRRPVGRLADWLHGRFLIPAFEGAVKRRRTFAYARELSESQWWPTARLIALQTERLERLLRHAAKTSPFYRESCRANGMDPDAPHDLTDLTRWPITTKTLRVARRYDFRTASARRLYTKGTSGSTGEPLIIDYDAGSLERRMAAAFRAYGWAGAPPGAKQFYFWGVPLLGTTTSSRVKEAIHHWLYRRDVVTSLGFSDASLDDLTARYESSRAKVVVAFTRPLYEWASLMRASGIQPTPPEAILVGAERVAPSQRAVIEGVFAAPVFETYGCREVMLVGAECAEHRGLHIPIEHLVVEIVDDDGRAVPPGTEGRVVVTDLFNYGAPFIRFDLGDRAVASSRACACGRGLPLLERVVGRQLEVLLTPDGRRVAGELFAVLFKDQLAVARYQAVQRQADSVTLQVQLRAEWTPELRAATLLALRAHTGPAMTIDLQVVDRIAEGPGGKLAVVSNPWLASLREQSPVPAVPQ